MDRFHVAIHSAPARSFPQVDRESAGRTLRTLDVRPEDLAEPIPTSFEEALAALERLPRMFVEPDGSFVWVGGDDEPAWQLDGVLYDRAGALVYVELKGTCPRRRFDELLAAFGWPSRRFLFQFVREAWFVEEDEFRRWAEGVR